MSALVIERSLSEGQLVSACLKLGSNEDRQPGYDDMLSTVRSERCTDEPFIVAKSDLQTTNCFQLKRLDTDAEEQQLNDEVGRGLETLGILATVSAAELTDRESANATVEQTF